MEIVKHINDTNASFRNIGKGNAQNTDLFLDSEHYEFFKDAGEKITVRFNKENLTKAILFIASILPRKYDNPPIHSTIPFSVDFVYDQLTILDAFFDVDGQKVETRTQTWNVRKDVPTKKGKIDNRFYFNGLLEDISYKNSLGESITNKFTIRNYLAGGYSDLHFKKSENGIFDVWVTNLTEPHKIEKSVNAIDSQDTLLFEAKVITTFILSSVKYFYSKDKLNALIPYASTDSPVKVSKDGVFSLVGMFLEASIEEVKQRNEKVSRWFEDKFTLGDRVVYLSKMWNGKGDYQLMLDDFIKMIQTCYGENYVFLKEGNKYQLWKTNGTTNYDTNHPLQQIYYGAPGTGKSNEIKRLTAEGKFTKDFTFRTTFHPDSDYSTFVGAYKPVWDDIEEKIVYEFRPQAFLKAYVAAWTHPDDDVALVVEEINRGNCAQIFGDIFQLLDREVNGLSKYPIEADIDMQKFLFDALNGVIKEDWAGIIPEEEDNVAEINTYYIEHYINAFDKIKVGKILSLPKNLSILATMNTSDQSLFPMDSAFKRRWDWKYQPIVKGVDSETKKELDWFIDIKGYNPIDWWEFLERINKVISDLTTSEDKQLGYFFCMPDKKVNNADKEPTLISTERFVEKVVFYLWNDVFKDYSYDPDCCNKKDSTDKVLYADFYNKNSNTINIDVLVYFINQLKAIDKNDNSVLATKPSQTPPANEQNAGVNNKDDVGGEDNNEVDEGKAVNNETGQQLQLPIDNKQPE